MSDRYAVDVPRFTKLRSELDSDIAREVGFIDDSPIKAAARIDNAVSAGANEYMSRVTFAGTRIHEDGTTREIPLSIEGARTWPPNDTVLTSRADWTH